MENLFPTDYRSLPKLTIYCFLANVVLWRELEKLFLGIFWIISDRGKLLKFFLQILKIDQIAYLTMYISLYYGNGVLLRYWDRKGVIKLFLGSLTSILPVAFKGDFELVSSSCW